MKDQLSKKQVMLAGFSGSGKTTLAKALSEDNLPFISGSVSDLLPQTKDEPHRSMLDQDPKKLYMQDFQILNLRKKLFANKSNYISDRSFLDNAAYFILKQSKFIPQCEVDNFLKLCNKFLTQLCTHLILLDYTPDMLTNWVIEDNSKRIQNGYFQMQVAYLMRMVLDIWGFKGHFLDSHRESLFHEINLPRGIYLGKVESLYGVTRVMILREVNMQNRLFLTQDFINDKL